MTDQRVAEAKKLGFKRCVLPKVSMDSLKDTSGIELIGISNVKEAQDLV
jgi:DNA repair protein RadA/Sms